MVIFMKIQNNQKKIVHLSGISKSFFSNGSSKEIFSSVDLCMYEGGLNALTGKNGSGKTTLVKIICSLIRPDEGNVSVFGENIFSQSKKNMRNIGVVFSSARMLYWKLTAWQNLKYLLGLKGISIKDIVALLEDIMKSFEIWDARHHLVQEFSQGMQQKLMITNALAIQPKLLLLDEPTSNLDVHSVLQLKNFLSLFSIQNRMTSLITSHNIDFIKNMCDNIYVIHDKKIDSCN